MSDEPTVDGDVDDALSDLRAARSDLRDVEAEIDDVGEERVVAAADAYREATGLLDRYEESAVGTGDFQAYLEFQEKFMGFVEDLPDDLPARESFESASDRMDRRRLRDRDFAGARDDLEAAETYVDLLERRDDAQERRREAESRCQRLRRDLRDRIDYLERLVELGDVDLDAPVERIRDPVEAYNESVREAFESLLDAASARETFRVLEVTESYPLVEFRQPPPDLREYVESEDAGEEPVSKLLEYADYSNSKLAHYVDDPGALKTTVAVHRTYLDRLGPDPLTVSWPPPAADRLRYLAGELVSVVARFAGEETVARARRLREVANRDDYERLRRVALARAELGQAERERLRSGEVDTELERARERHERVVDALEADE